MKRFRSSSSAESTGSSKEIVIWYSRTTRRETRTCCSASWICLTFTGTASATAPDACRAWPEKTLMRPRFAVVILVAFLAMPLAGQNRRGRNRPLVDLPRGPVRQVILDSCTTCHGIDDYAYYAMDRAGWQKLIDTMKDKGAVISDD